MKTAHIVLASALALLPPAVAGASGHRDAPLVAFDRAADITDVFAFRAYDGGPTPSVAIIMSLDSQLEPSNGPLWSTFDPDIRYEIDVDNDDDAEPDVRFVFRFQTEQRLPDVFQAYLGAGAGVTAPANSPPPVAPGTTIVPPKITTFASVGLGTRQSYTVTMFKGGVATPLVNGGGLPFFALPANVGPRTLDHEALRSAATYSLANGVKVFAGTTDDAFAADEGGLSDTYNVRSAVSGGVLTPTQDATAQNVASDSYSGFSVNSIAIQVPIAMLTRTGAIEPAGSPAATIGVWGSTFRRIKTKRQPAGAPVASGGFIRVQRMGNPFVNQLLIGMDAKNSFSVKPPSRDSRFSAELLDPFLARFWNAATGGAVAIPTPPRNDLLPLFTYAPPIAAPGTAAGPIADLLRLNTGIPPTAVASASRLGLLGGDAAGFPNGRRLFDDVTDLVLRIVAGGVLNPSFNVVPNNRLGDGVNVNDAPFRTTFPYLAAAPSGRDRRHIDPGEAGCTAGAGSACSP